MIELILTLFLSLFPAGVDYGSSGKSVNVSEILPKLYGEYRCTKFTNVYGRNLNDSDLLGLNYTKDARIIMSNNFFAIIHSNHSFFAENPKYFCYNLAHDDPVSIWEFPLAHRTEYFNPDEWRERIFYVIVSNCVTNNKGEVDFWQRRWHFEIQTNGLLISLENPFVYVWGKVYDNTKIINIQSKEKSWWQFWK